MLPRLTAAYTASFGSGVEEGYGENLFSVAWDSPDAEMIRHLQSNVYEFSSAKSYQQLKALTMALYDKDGKLVPEKEYLEIARRINKEMSITHLKVERNTAIAGGQMSSRWVQFIKEEDKFGNITYRTVGDAAVRPSHAAMNGITLPIRHVFWTTNYPPNGWECRCDAEQSVNGTITPEDKINYPDDTPPMFKTNLAQNGLIFPEGHPYYDELPEEVIKAAAGRNPFEYNKVHKGKKGGYVYNNAISNANDDELLMARTLADQGHKVIMLPEIHPSGAAQQELRKLCLPDSVPKNKNTDALVNGELVDFKNITNTPSALNNAIRKGRKQAAIICINMPQMPYKEIINAIKPRVEESDAVKEVWIMIKGKTKKISRKDIVGK